MSEVSDTPAVDAERRALVRLFEGLDGGSARFNAEKGGTVPEQRVVTLFVGLCATLLDVSSGDYEGMFNEAESLAALDELQRRAQMRVLAFPTALGRPLVKALDGLREAARAAVLMQGRGP